jgi:hypothetical protein
MLPSTITIALYSLRILPSLDPLPLTSATSIRLKPPTGIAMSAVLAVRITTAAGNFKSPKTAECQVISLSVTVAALVAHLHRALLCVEACTVAYLAVGVWAGFAGGIAAGRAGVGGWAVGHFSLEQSD